VAIFLLADAIKKVTQGSGTQATVWSPPYLFSANAALVGGIVSYGLLLLAPKIPDYVKAIFEPKAKVPPVGATIFAPIGGAAGIAKAPIAYPAGVMKAGWEKRAGEVFGQLPARDIREKGPIGAAKAFIRGMKGESIARPTTLESQSPITMQRVQPQRNRLDTIKVQNQSKGYQAISDECEAAVNANNARVSTFGGTPDVELQNIAATAKKLAGKSQEVEAHAKEALDTATKLENAQGMKGVDPTLIPELQKHLTETEDRLNQAREDQDALEKELRDKDAAYTGNNLEQKVRDKIKATQP
jgi:hypothetical protein